MDTITSEQDSIPAPPSTVAPQDARTPIPYEYYSAPVTARPVVPRGLALGCGVAAALFLVAFFAAGAFVSTNGGGGGLLVGLFKAMRSDLAPMMTRDVSAAQRHDFDAQADLLERNGAAGKIRLPKLQKFFTSLQSAIGDHKLTPAEVTSLTNLMRDANDDAAHAHP